KGIMEIADLIVINKADINPQAATVARAQIKSALGMLRHTSPHWTPPVLMLSALQKQGVAEFWKTVNDYRTTMQASGEFDSRRRHQAQAWMWDLIDQGLRARFAGHPAVQNDLPALQAAVEAGRATPSAAAARLLGHLG
ncbi:MAG TPA: methylmalonyl Co-A mutase-associated GTPase MeaB, partial [Rhodocyclaceae bacterium]|nr:methylmalonyl Co-A mutase-associated GTPase MeaB [Rhodocyclaceae bacterium]